MGPPPAPAARGPTGGGGAAPRRGPADQRDRADPRLPGRHREVARLARARPAARAAGRRRDQEGNDDRSSTPWRPRWAHCATPTRPPWTTSCSPAGSPHRAGSVRSSWRSPRTVCSSCARPSRSTATRRRSPRPTGSASPGRCAPPTGHPPVCCRCCAGAAAPTPPLDLSGLSEFERNVLAATRTIPAGETRPYGWVAREAGRPRAVRAVASVLARNPVPLLVPCHRVVRADGAVGRYLFGAEHKEDAAARRGREPRRRRRPRPPRRALPGQRHHRDRLLPDLPPRAAHHPGAPGRVRHRRGRRRRRIPAVPLLPSR